MILKPSLFVGRVFHQRFIPRKHAFQMRLSSYFLPVDGDEHVVQKAMRDAGIRGAFHRHDYFGTDANLGKDVRKKASDLAQREIRGDVYFLGQVRQWGYYFSPVNFYLIKSKDTFHSMLAEVTNTPWNEKHCYFVDLQSEQTHQKVFHVSPFNPMDMIYRWKVKVTDKKVFIKISCYRDRLEFEAALMLTQSLTLKRNFLFTNFKIILGIYLHAFFLFLKKTPYFPHPRTTGKT